VFFFFFKKKPSFYLKISKDLTLKIDLNICQELLDFIEN